MTIASQRLEIDTCSHETDLATQLAARIRHYRVDWRQSDMVEQHVLLHSHMKPIGISHVLVAHAVVVLLANMKT